METCLDDQQLNRYITHLDDIIIFSKTSKDQLIRLRVVLEKLKQVGPKLKPIKSELLKSYIMCLAHRMSEASIETDTKKTEVI